METKATGPIKARLVFVHGFSEHINRYNDFFPKLGEHGIEVMSWDQRGWGRSVTKPAEKGLTGPTSQVIADVAAFISDKLPSDVPVFVMGHSMGGGEILTLAGDNQYKDFVSQVRGWILEAPFIGFAKGEEPSFIKIYAGRLVGRLLPRQQLKHVVPPEQLTRDLAIVESVRNDPLCHNTGTLEGMASLLDRTATLSSGAIQLGSHVQGILLAHGTQDLTCSYEAAKNWLEQQNGVADKSLKSYDGGYHQLHTDHCKEDFAEDLVEWILQRCGGSNDDVDAPIGSKL